VSGPLDDVVLAISAFRSDDSVLALLDRVFTEGVAPFHTVLIVDSLGSGTIPAVIATNKWPVVYHNASLNLGSAGNLAMRLRLAAETSATWCYAVNHDGDVDAEKVSSLLNVGSREQLIGAVYPTLLFTRRANTRDAPRQSLSPHGSFLVSAPEGIPDVTPVLWSSSNCALYCLDAVRSGVQVWADLWMGWEDLAYGWQLHQAGWKQLLCTQVAVPDSYEYTRVSFFGISLFVSEKPNWYAYYLIRNLLLISRRTKGNAISWQVIARRAVVELLVTLLYRKRKTERLKLFIRGYADGLAGSTGKADVP
jgi:GT2 family glycosyltransferase